MIKVIKIWFHRYFSDPQAVFLAILLLAIFTVLMTMSELLAPVLVSLVIAYLLEGLVKGLQRRQFPRTIAVFLVYLAFIVLYFAFVMLLPWLSLQLDELIAGLPAYIKEGSKSLSTLPEKFDFLSKNQINGIIDLAGSKATDISQTILSYSLASIPVVIIFVVYSILVPLLVFFFLKDKQQIFNWFAGFLPTEHSVVKRIWVEMDAQMGNYVRGKVYEIFLVGSFTYFVFAYLDLKYASLLAVLVGLSVIIPYVGAVVVTFPVVIVAYFQWGVGADFFWVVGAYFVVQALDGNFLVPLLFSEAVNLHPVAIIMAVLVFGGFWGIWGVFFAIPLATLVKALLLAWPRTPVEEGS
ncbi:MAG: AI-2E family transporter [Candidatus Parabeggiatoa sp. nov. 1]|nr:MAG: AI-2E family transporter [Gammaproteobacteria bacterium]